MMAAMAQEISTVPEIVNIIHYGGDTLVMGVTIAADFVPANALWAADVKAAREDPDAQASFTISYEIDADRYLLTLSAADARMLVDSYGVLYSGAQVKTIAPELFAAGLTTLRMFTGDWDVQMSGENGADPVLTLAQGRLSVWRDVTRTP